MTQHLKVWQKEWQCTECHDIIYSRYSGEFVSCTCGKIAIDQTEWYSRFIGEPECFKEVPYEGK